VTVDHFTSTCWPCRVTNPRRSAWPRRSRAP